MSDLILRLGARNSPLSLTQSRNALAELKKLLPALTIELLELTSPGDEDRTTDLRVSDPDFFTRYLDQGVLSGELDGAIHSAKDLPDPLTGGIDWFWLPWREDPRDAVILRQGETFTDLPPKPVIGVSSERRDAYCRARFPDAIFKPVRGNIEHRLAQLDNGDFDVMLMAGCALLRLGMEARISEWIPLSDLQSPPGQGYLAVTFRQGDERFQRLRNLLTPAVTMISAGPGDPGLCPSAGLEALRRCDLCLYDALAPHALLDELKPGAAAIFVGKRRDHYSIGRRELESLMVNACKEGKHVVRLKGGDAGIFARLAQETEALMAHGLPFRVIPGVSSLLAATTGTGMALTRKGLSRGFCAVTPEQLSESEPCVGMEDRQALPIAFFMAVNRLSEILAELHEEGRPGDEPATMVFGASTPRETILPATLDTIEAAVQSYDGTDPGLLLVGDIAAKDFLFDRTRFALQGKRVLLTCSRAIMPKAIAATEDLGGIPVPLPLIHLQPKPDAKPVLAAIADYDWLVVTSPSAVRCLFQLLDELRIDRRVLPRILLCGPGTAQVFIDAGIYPDAGPTDTFSGEAMLAAAKEHIQPGQRVLRLRSDKAGPSVQDALRDFGAEVTDCILYRNQALAPDELPPADAIFLASGSAVDAFVEAWGTEALAALDRVAIGEPTARVLRSHGLEPHTIAHQAIASASLQSLAAHYFLDALQRLGD